MTISNLVKVQADIDISYVPKSASLDDLLEGKVKFVSPNFAKSLRHLTEIEGVKIATILLKELQYETGEFRSGEGYLLTLLVDPTTFLSPEECETLRDVSTSISDVIQDNLLDSAFDSEIFTRIRQGLSSDWDIDVELILPVNH